MVNREGKLAHSYPESRARSTISEVGYISLKKLKALTSSMKSGPLTSSARV